MEIDEYYKDIDRVFRLPRVWSNRELLKFAKLFKGDVANISGWTDEDKEGAYYKDYFSNVSSYSITNYIEEARGFQGKENEVFLDLTAELPNELINKFDVVFNQTVLEHIYEVNLAVKNLCSMTKDIAIVVVPFLQEMHANYGDYWRFTPLAMKNLFNENDISLNFEKLEYLLIEKEGILIPFFVEKISSYKSNNFLIEFEDIKNEDEAKKLLNSNVFTSYKLIYENTEVSLEKKIIGFKIIDKQFGDLGNIQTINNQSSQALVFVKNNNKEFCFPLEDHFIDSIEIEQKIVYTKIPEEIIDLN